MQKQDLGGKSNIGRADDEVFHLSIGAGLVHRPAGWTVISVRQLSRPSTGLRRPAFPRMSCLFLRLEQMGIVMKEFLDVILHAQDFGPLFFVERDWEPADSVQ